MIATTQEQGVRLLRCGVPADTADMSWVVLSDDTETLTAIPNLAQSEVINYPAWSLSALCGLLPKEIKVDPSPYDEIQEYGLLIYPFMGGWQVDYQYCEDDECYCLKCVHDTDPIEACVQLIEWLKENGYKLNEQ